MSAPLLWRHLAGLRSAPMSAITVAAAGSFAGQIMAVIQGAPLWVYLVAAVAPWVPVFALEVVWAYRHYKWLAVFCVLILSQAAYLLEHAARVIEIDLLGRADETAPGVFGQLDLERILTLWSIWAFLAILLLVSRFPRNVWIWLCLVMASLDAAQHVRLIGVPDGGAEYTLAVSFVEFATLVLAFMSQVARTYDAWLARAFPNVPEHVLIETTGKLEEVRLRAGERIEPNEGRWYIVTRGRGSLVRSGPGGHDILLRVLSPGQVVRGDGTLCADSTLEVLAVPAIPGPNG